MNEKMINAVSALDGLIWQAIELYSINTIEQFLLDPDCRVRSAAINRLQMHGGGYAFSLACELIESRSKEVRMTGIILIGQIKDLDDNLRAASVRKLVVLLEKESSSRVKSEVITSLGHLQDRSVIKYLLKFLTHKNRKIRAALAVALSRLGGDAVSEKALNSLKKDKSPYVRYWAS